MMRKTEILSPAGNAQAAYQAIHNGADAIYMGGKDFGARAFAGNFSYDEMKKTIDYAHLYGVAVYVTVNTLVFQDETDAFFAHLKTIYEMGADAFIVQDIGMAQKAAQTFSDIEIHASTQMHNHNDACLCLLKDMGFSRAVLAREMSLGQIESLECDIQKEVFVHGALCVSYSGQCLMSFATQDRSGNRGRCAQSCRMKYSLVDDSGKTYDAEGEYLISPKDLALLEDIDKLTDAGVCSFKIEGRMKSPEYVGLVTKIYSELRDEKKLADGDTDDLRKLFNRGYTKGHLLCARNSELMGTIRPNHRGTPLGRVISVGKDRIALKLTGTLNQGDGIKFEQSDTGFICNMIYKNGKLANSAMAGDVIELDAKVKVRTGESVVKTSDTVLEKSLAEVIEKKIAVTGRLTVKIGQTSSFSLSDGDGNTAISTGDEPQIAKTAPTVKSELEAGISKLGDTPFSLIGLECDCDENIFMAKSQVNALRRSAVEKLALMRTNVPQRRIVPHTPKAIKKPQNDAEIRLNVLARTEEQLICAAELNVGDVYIKDERLYEKYRGKFSGLRLKTDKLEERAKAYDGARLLATDNGSLHVNGRANDIVTDYSLHAANSDTVAYFMSMGAKRVTLSPELSPDGTHALVSHFERIYGFRPPVEAVIYSRLELMASKQCVIATARNLPKNCGACKERAFSLRDINQNEFPIVTDDACNSYILGCRYIHADVVALLAGGVTHFRAELTDEDAESSEKILRGLLSELGIKDDSAEVK